MTARSIFGEISLDPQIADALQEHERIIVHYWNHNTNSSGWFIKTIQVLAERPTPLESFEGKIALYTNRNGSSKHEKIVEISLKEFFEGNPSCALCAGRGVRQVGHDEGCYDTLCECGKGGSWKKKFGQFEFFSD